MKINCFGRYQRKQELGWNVQKLHKKYFLKKDTKNQLQAGLNTRPQKTKENGNL